MSSYATIAQLRESLPQVPEYGQQRITIVGGASGGTFALDYEGTTTTTLTVNATAKQMQSALRAISDIGANGVNVKGRPGSPWVASFQGSLATDAAPLTLTANNLTGGSSPTVEIVPDTDSDLQNALDRATSIIRDYLRAELPDSSFDFVAYGSADTQIVRGYWSHLIQIPAHQMGSISLIERQITTNPESFVLLSDQWIERANGQLYRAAGWDNENYRITAVWGYGSNIPDSIIELTLELAANIWRTRDTGGFVDIVGVDGSGSIRHIIGLNKQQQMIITNVRNQLMKIWI